MNLHLAMFAILVSPGLAFAEDQPAAAQSEKKEITIEEFLQSLSTVQGVVTRRDPFVEAGPPFEIPKTEIAIDENAPLMGAPVLERYSIAEYEVVAVLLGDKYPRALLRLPKEGGKLSGKVVIVREGDKLGNRKGVIARVSPEGLVVQQAMRSKHGFVDKTEVLLKVGGTSEQQRSSLTAVNRGGG